MLAGSHYNALVVDRWDAMPIYEYRCHVCGHELEKIQRMNDAPLTDCPDCGAAELRRLVSAPGFRLKGAGWYETDFKKDGKRNLHESQQSVNGSADKSAADGGTETKKEAKKAPEAGKSAGATSSTDSGAA